MPFDFNEFLILAEELANKGDEASKRSSISRAYYTLTILHSRVPKRMLGHIVEGGSRTGFKGTKN